MRWIIKALKITAITVLCIIILFAALLLCFIYVTRWSLTDIATEVSPDGRYRILFQEVGEADWPFGNSHAKITVYDGKSVIRQFREDISDDGARNTVWFRWIVLWAAVIMCYFPVKKKEIPVLRN